MSFLTSLWEMLARMEGEELQPGEAESRRNAIGACTVSVK
jgi:hypothetical protein